MTDFLMRAAEAGTPVRGTPGDVMTALPGGLSGYRPPPAVGGGAQKMGWWGANTYDPAGQRFFAFLQADSTTTVADGTIYQYGAVVATTLAAIFVWALNAAPAEDRTLEIYKNGAATGLTCVLASGTQFATGSGALALGVGDRVALGIIGANPDAGVPFYRATVAVE